MSTESSSDPDPTMSPLGGGKHRSLGRNTLPLCHLNVLSQSCIETKPNSSKKTQASSQQSADSVFLGQGEVKIIMIVTQHSQLSGVGHSPLVDLSHWCGCGQ